MLTLPHLFWQLEWIVCDIAEIINRNQATSTTFVSSRDEVIAACNSSSRILRLSNCWHCHEFELLKIKAVESGFNCYFFNNYYYYSIRDLSSFFIYKCRICLLAYENKYHFDTFLISVATLLLDLQKKFNLL